jgi:hypothetical protein
MGRTVRRHRHLFAQAITLRNESGNIFKVNGQCLKIFLELNKTLDEEVDIIELIDYEP